MLSNTPYLEAEGYCTLHDVPHIVEKAWKALCEATANGAHQFDSWDQVPVGVQNMYIEQVR